jgi:hypothetical protein
LLSPAANRIKIPSWKKKNKQTPFFPFFFLYQGRGRMARQIGDAGEKSLKK